MKKLWHLLFCEAAQCLGCANHFLRFYLSRGIFCDMCEYNRIMEKKRLKRKLMEEKYDIRTRKNKQ